MTFSVSPVEGFIFDMRQVPFIIGTFYGGRRVGFFLLLMLLFYRYFSGGLSGFYASLIIYPLLYLSLWFLTPLFRKVHQIKFKVYITVIAAIFGAVLLIIVVKSFNPGIDLDKLLFLFVLYTTQYIWIAICTYIFERTRSEMLLVDELKKLERLKNVSEIAASISHEVRNPITVTRGFIQLLRDNDLEADKKELYINLSLNELDRAERIITDYLTFAKPSLENIEILEINNELDYVIEVVNPYATLNNVNLELERTRNLYITGEAQKLHQCLINIIKNSVEAIEHGGKVSIKLSQSESLNQAIIIIRDNGIGMDEEQLSKLGTPYYSTKGKGTGLGTMVSFSIIKVMGGHIEVESEVGKGTSFMITFPLAINRELSSS